MDSSAVVMTSSVLRALGESAMHAAPAPPEKALRRLRRGNDRFVGDQLRHRDVRNERPGWVKGQHPYAVVLTCADSRLSPEILFDEAMGRLFVVRVAGNVVDPVVLGSIEYAAEHLHTRLVMVLGHHLCGAVQAALEGGHSSHNLGQLVGTITPAAEAARGKGLDAKGTLSEAVRENARLQAAQAVADSTILADRVASGEVMVVSAVYHLDSGRVEMLDPQGR